MNERKMRQAIWVKAEKLKNKVKPVGEVRDKRGKISYFEVEDVQIEIICDGKKTFINSCTCTHCSVHSAKAQICENKLALCSYKIAVMKALPINTELFKPVEEGQKMFLE